MQFDRDCFKKCHVSLYWYLFTFWSSDIGGVKTYFILMKLTLIFYKKIFIYIYVYKVMKLNVLGGAWNTK